MYRYTTPGIFQKLDPLLTWKINEEEKVIYLTFDDGPHPRITSRVLDLLKSYHAKATFFCVGENVSRYPDIYQRLLDEGHSTGNHTFNHINGWTSENEVYLSNVDKCSTVVKSNLFRPPYGRIGLRQAIRLRRKDYRVIMWSLLSRDFEKDLNQDESLRALIDHTTKGSIVLFHDSEKAENNLFQLLPAYLRYCASEGYVFRAL